MKDLVQLFVDEKIERKLMDIPHPDNFCGGAFKDWLEVYLTDKCNGTCSWCVDKDGYKPGKRASSQSIIDVVQATDKKNIILLGGEPTLYRNLRHVIDGLAFSLHPKNVYLTTNGSKLTQKFVKDKLSNLAGINISIHDTSLRENKLITGVDLDYNVLVNALNELAYQGVKVRFNCNCIKGHIDSQEKMQEYVAFAEELGANSVRFAELKHDNGSFVNLAKELKYDYGLTDNPFKTGCSKTIMLRNTEINIRLMCGLQTDQRPKPVDPKLEHKQVLYYDGKLYDGWQTAVVEQLGEAAGAATDWWKVEDTPLARLMRESAVKPAKTPKKPKKPKKPKQQPVATASGGCCY